MRLLFDMDKKDHAECTHSFVRNSARSVIVRDGKVAMVHSLKYDYFKFPGGGIEEGETPVQAMIRETREEAGLTVVPETVREYGYVHRIRKSIQDETECFVQDNFYYLCSVEENVSEQALDEYESEERFTLEFTDPTAAIEKNRRLTGETYVTEMAEREASVLEMLIEEGVIG